MDNKYEIVLRDITASKVLLINNIMLGVYTVKLILCEIYTYTLSRTNKFLHTFCFTNIEFLHIQLYNRIIISIL